MYVLGIDLGTNNVKSLILELETGRILKIGQKSYGYIKGTSAEQDPRLVLEMVVQSINGAISDSGINAEQIECVGLSGQMHGTVLYDRTGKRISNIITWEDDRCDKSFLDEIADIGGEDVQKSGCGIATGFLGPTLYYIVRYSAPEIGHVLLPTDWLRQELTNERTFLTDHSNGSSSGFFDTQNRNWNYNLIRKLGLPEDIFPRAVHTYVFDGGVSESTANVTGLKVGTPVTVGGGDQPLSMIGSGICEPADGFLLNIGTGSQVSKVSEEYAKKDDTIAFCFPGRGYSLLGAALSGGASLNWWRSLSEECARIYGLDTSEANIYDEMIRLATEIPPGAEGLTFIPYLRGTRLKPQLKASFIGVTRHHGYAHFTRAILEGVIFELYDFYEKLGVSDENVPMIAAGGGFTSRLWSQIAADIFNREIRITMHQEQAALGAALIAGVGFGYYPNMKEACKVAKYKPEVINPIKENVDKYKRVYETQYNLL